MRQSGVISGKRLIILITIVVTMLSVMFGGCGAAETGNWNGVSKQSFYFDTICEVTVFDLEDGIASDDTEEAFTDSASMIISDAFKLMSGFERTLSRTIEGSDIDRINHSGAEPVEVNGDTIEVIRKGIEFGVLSGGVFDITVGKASELWDFHEGLADDEAAELPGEDLLNDAVKHIDFTKIEISDGAENRDTGNEDPRNENSDNIDSDIDVANNKNIESEGTEDGSGDNKDINTVRLEDPEMILDLGGIAKGYIADKVSEYLKSRGVVSGIVNLGGNIEVIGGKSTDFNSHGSEQIDFNLGIRDPRNEDGAILGIYPARDATIVTSGTYERYITVDGIKYHHILDPDTGYPVDTDVLQVSLIADSGHSIDCDGLSTICLALGTEEGSELIRQLNEDGRYGGIEAIFVTNDGDVIYTNDDTAFIAG